ncbi:MAG: tRNA (adenosine(37)-N6)-threonylcarbamoyltransferase complex ATPase subunit type 1 TsaE [Bacteroides sp.]|nr:MAG: tRNA (adenosine(37)-N6)-threonylcarbamoyltransferase complex ATPase subunit type 1 TsaE [Bacteroides sp.]
MIYQSVKLVDIESIASLYSHNRLFLLYGDLGSGKTTLVKSICNILGVYGNVTSPTYSLINEYKRFNNDLIYHCDMYRINKLQDAIDIGISDYIFSKSIVFIEWPEKIVSIISKDMKYISIDIDIESYNSRKISIKEITI